MPDEASAAQEAAALIERVKFALESGDLDAIRDLLDPGSDILKQYGGDPSPRPPAPAGFHAVATIPPGGNGLERD
jgi:hypothetical protein